MEVVININVVSREHGCPWSGLSSVEEHRSQESTRGERPSRERYRPTGGS